MTQTKKPSKPKTAAKKPVKTVKKPAVKKPARKTSKPDEPPKEIYYCSFCRKSSDEVLALVAGPNYVFICDNCVELCMAILLDDENPDKNTPKIWRQRITDLLANPKKFDIRNVDEPKNKGRKKNA
jgi:hypothetical protein